MAIDDAIDEFCAAIGATGVAPPRSPSDTAVLDEIEVAVAPLRVPTALRRVWERLDPRTVRSLTQPRLTSPSFALEAWRGHEREPGQVPRVLFPLAYESWQFAFVELHGSHEDDGGTVFRWEYGGSDFFLTQDTVEDWFTTQTRALADRRVFHGDGTVHAEHAQPARIAAALLARRGPHPTYGTTTALPEATTRWPHRWLVRSGIARDRHALGRTCAVVDAAAALARGETVRVHALVTALAGAGWTRATITDGTGQLDVACPPLVSAFGPIIGTRFEFELASGDEQPADQRLPAPEPLTGIDAGGALTGAHAMAAERLRPWQRRADATARAIRPLGR